MIEYLIDRLFDVFILADEKAFSDSVSIMSTIV